jgi:predicted RNA-binding protein YlxR (DUF448 family)
MSKGSHKPVRTCLGCRQQDSSDALVRLAVESGAVVADFEARRPGRGGYLHPRPECLEKFINSKQKEFRSLKRAISRDDRGAVASAIRNRPR